MITLLTIAAFAADNDPVTPREPLKVHWPHSPDSVINITPHKSPNHFLFWSVQSMLNNAELYAIPEFETEIQHINTEIMSPSLRGYALEACDVLQSKANEMKTAISDTRQKLEVFSSLVYEGNYPRSLVKG